MHAAAQPSPEIVLLRLRTVDDEIVHTTLGDFLSLNAETMGEDEITALCALTVGETYHGWGYVGSTWDATRIA